jgi:hypothetical protein
VTKYNVITSIASGNFNTPATWDCNCDPPDYSNIVVDSGHVVTMTANEIVTNLSINAYGTLDNSTFRIDIYGNYTINGDHTGSGGTNADRIYLYGDGTYIDGTGTISHPSRIRIWNNHKTILSTADIKRPSNGELYIQENIVVSNYGTFEQGGRMHGVNSTATWFNAENSTLKFGDDLVIGNITLNASGDNNTVEYYRAGTQEIKIPTDNSYQNLIISGSGNKNLTADISVEGDLSISSVLNSNGNDIQLAGDWTNTGVFNEGTGQVVLVGASDQSIGNPVGETFYDLVVNEVSGQVLLTNDVTVSNLLSMNGGNIATQGNTLILGTGTGNIGTLSHTSGTVSGRFERWISGTGVPFLFPIGTDAAYRPASITFNALTDGSLISEFVSDPPGNSGLPLTDGTVDVGNVFVEGYWTLTRANSLASSDYDLDLTGTGFSSFPIVAETRLLLRSGSTADWIVEGTHVAASGSTASRANLATLSAEYAFGDTSTCSPPVTSAITGSNSVCSGGSGETYSVNPSAGSSFQWNIAGGVVSSGQGTNSVTVDWGSTGMQGTVQVIETNACTQGAPVELNVDIHPLPTSAISGEVAVAAGATGVVYSVDGLVGYTYDWTITGGVLGSGQGTPTVTVDWGAGSSGTVSVIATHTACSQSAPAEQLDITIYPVITSIATGNWENPTTWDCTCVPSSSSNVVIATGHTVTVNGATTVNNLSIESGAVLNSQGNLMTINGDYLVNGEHAGTGGGGSERIYLDGIGTFIGGTGTVSNTGRLRIRQGNKEILSSADLSKTSGDFYIENNLTVTNNGSIFLGGNVFTSWNTVYWVNASGSTLTLGNEFLWNNGQAGILIASAPDNTIIYNEASDQRIKIPQDGEYFNLSLEGTNNKIMYGDLTILGDLSISSTLNSANFDIEIGGDWSNTSTFNEGSGEVIFNGTGPQTINTASGETFYDLTINKSSDTLSLASDVNISGALDMLSGNISTSSNTLTLGINTTTIGTLNHSAGTVVGTFERWMNSTGVDYLFPIGTSTYYRPVTINFNNLTAGSLIVGFNPSAPGSSGLPVDDAGVSVVNTFVEGYWELTRANSLNSSDYNVDLTGNGFSTFPVIDATRIVSRASSGSDWTASGTHVAAVGNTASRDNVSILSAELALGDTTNCSIPVTSDINGPTAVCTGSSGNSYSVTNTPGSSYTWTVTGGSITSAQGLNFVFVDWGSTGMAGSVEVVEDNGCGQGAPVLLDVEISPIPTSPITGNTAVASGATGETYSVTEIPGYTYTWTITGNGSIASGQGTGTITVDWGAAGTALISVVGGNGCGLAPAEELSVDIFDVIVSAQTGNWNVPTTWVGGVVPTAVNSARIAPGHTVTTTATRTINNLIIDAGAVLNTANFYFYVNGNYTLDGEHQGTANDRVRLNGLGATIDGTGVYSHTGILYIQTGNKTIASNADLTINVGLRINNNILVTNYGRISVIGQYGIWGSNLGATWINAEDSYLYVDGPRVMNNGGNGTLTASAAGNTVVYADAADMLVETPTGNSYHHLTIAGSGTKTMQANLSISGDLTISSTLNANNFDLELGGDWINSGYFTEGAGSVTFNGSGDQTITNALEETFNDLVVDKGSGILILNGNVVVSNNLTLNNGIVQTGANKLTLGTSIASIGSFTRNSGWIHGKLERWLNTTGTDYDFPVGSASDYNPATINFTALTSGSLEAEFISSNPGNGGLPLTEATLDINNTFVDGYWAMTKANALESNDYDLALTGNGLTSFSITPETRLLTRASGSSDWTLNGTHQAASGSTVYRNGINLLSAEYAFGDTTNCTQPVTSAISGSSSRCVNDLGVPYFVTNTPGSTYTWTVTGGTVAGGQGTNSISVDWGATGMMAQIEVVENNGCTDGATVTLDVELGPLPTSPISGPIIAAAGETGISYSVVSDPGYTYTWSISAEGSITSGQGSNIVTVDWNTAGTGTLSVVGSNACGNASQVDLPVDVYDVFVSAASGNWNVGATWVGGVAPASASSARIAPGHVVTVTANTTINNLIIDNGGELNSQNYYFTVNGDYTLNGIHSGSAGDRVRLAGNDAVISGTGNLTHTGRIYINTGNKTIASGSNLTFVSTLLIGPGEIVTNYGSVDLGSDLQGWNATSTWINAENSTLILFDDFINGTVITSATGNTVAFGGTASNNVPRSQNDLYYHVIIEGSQIKTLMADVEIQGDLSISSTLNSGNFDITLGGSWSNSGTFTEGTGRVILNGSGDQSLSNPIGETFYELEISKSTGSVILSNNVTVSNTLNLNGGFVDAGTNIFELGTGTGNVGSLNFTSGRIQGKFMRWINTPGSLLYPVGNSSYYRPASISFNNLTGGSLTTEFVNSSPGSNGLPLDDAGTTISNTFTEGYWSMERGGTLTSSDYDLLLTGSGFTSFTPNDETRILLRPSSGSNWVVEGTHVAQPGNQANRTGMQTLSAEFAFGDTTNCIPPLTSAISGPVAVCTNSFNQSYSVVNTPGSTYNWTVNGGTISSGQGTNNILVTWGGTGMAGNVEVVENNGCTDGSTVTLDVDIGPLPTSSISGDIAVAIGASNVSYSIVPELGYTYTWSIAGDGTIMTGQGTGSITIDWGLTPGTAVVTVTGSNPCGDAADVTLDVDLFDVILSAQTGNWNVPATWIGGVVPSTNASARIQSGHTVTTTTNDAITNLIIDAGAVLNTQNFFFDIYGDYTLNGEHAGGGTGDRVRLRGLDATIDGTGTYSRTGNLYIVTGNKTIAPTANISIAADLRINNNLIITNYGTVTVNDDIRCNNAGSTWVNAENSTLNLDNRFISGTLIASSIGNTVDYFGAGNQNIIRSQDDTYYNLQASGANTKSLQADVTVLGDLTINSILNAANNTISLSGDWTNNGSFTEGTGTVIFEGTADQGISIAADPLFSNLTIDKNSGTLVLSDDAQVSSTLSMLNGNINANGNTLTLGVSTASIGTLSHFSGTILGKFERWVNTTGVSYNFPIGSASNIHEMLINFNNLTNGSIVTEFVSAAPGNAGLPLTDGPGTVNNIFTEGYWSTSRQNGMASTDYDLDIIANGFTSFGIDTSTRIVERVNSSSDWTIKGTHLNAAGNTVYRRNVNTSTLTSEFALGDPSLCTLPDDQSISGPTIVCKDATGVAYNVTDLGNTYTWTVTGGTITGGQGTNSITVDWGSTGMMGEVRMVETNVCGSGNPAVLDVSITPVATSTITGKTSVAENSTGEQYSVIPNVDYTYTWSINGGTLASGQDTETITVDWGAAGSGDVTVVASNVCGAADPEILAVNIYDVIISAQTGNWNVGTTWVGGVVPGTANSAVIDDGHTVTVTTNDEITNIAINPTATLNTQGFRFRIYGDYILNGIHNSTTSDRVELRGLDSYIDGTGSFTGNSRMYIVSGNKIISPTADLTLSNSLRINSNLIVTNQGQISIGNEVSCNNNLSTWINAENSTLTVANRFFRGILQASAQGNTVSWNGGGNQNIDQPFNSTFYHLDMGGAGIKYMPSDLTVLGDVTISSTFETNNFDLSLNGDWTNTGAFNEENGLVSFEGSTDQTITNASGETFNDLTVNKSSGDLILANDVVVSSDLVMSSGNIDPGINTLSLGTGTAATGTLTHSSGTVTGKFERWINATGSNILFPVGTESFYRPGLILFTDLTSGSLIGEFLEADPGTNGLPLADGADDIHNTFVEGYWALTTANSLASTDYNLELTGNGFTTFPMHSGVRLLTRPNSGANWVANGNNLSAVGNTARRSNLNILSAEYAFGDTTSCSLPVTSAITGNNAVCARVTGEVYSVVNTPGSTYSWTVTEGTITSGDGTNSITVDWGPNAVSGEVQVIENNGCADGAPVTLTVTLTEAPYSSISKSDLDCFGASDGSITVTPVGGIPVYSYLWSTLETTPGISGLSAGDYTVTVTDGNTCSWDTTVSILEPAQIVLSSSSTDVSCFGGNNGTATVTASGGTPPYTYQWDAAAGSQTTATALNLAAGSYDVTVTDFRGCSEIETVIVFEPAAALSATTAVTDATCFGFADGTATAAPAGGTAPYSYLWDAAAGNQTTATAINLTAGIYSVTITDFNGCNLLVEDTVYQPTQISTSTNVTSVSCFGGSDGTATVTPSGGIEPYTYLWDVAAGSQTDSTAINLATGSYTVIVTDDNGCTANDFANVPQPAAPLTVSFTTTEINCPGGSNGQATAIPAGGTGPYTYLWDAAAGSQTTQTATGLSANTYSVTVTDALGCVIVDNVTVVESATPITVTSVDGTDPSCFGGTNGFATVNHTGGTGPFTYLWDDPLAQTTATASNLGEGTYNVIVTDATGCTDNGNVVLSQPTEIVTSIVGVDATCFGCNDGSADLTVGGGTPGYSYLWSHGPTSEDVSNLIAGTYSVRVTDAAGCTENDTVVIDQPDPFQFFLDSTTNISCPGGSDGIIYTHAEGGTRPYEFSINGGASWQADSTFTGLVAANYTVIVRDFFLYTRSINTTLIEVDITPPSVTCIADPTRNADAGQCYYTVVGTEFDPTGSSDNCGVVSVTNDFNGLATLAGAQIPDGTVVTWTATDGSLNTGNCSFTVTVNDTQAPSVNCIADPTRNADAGQCYYTVVGTEFDPTSSSDNCGVVSVTNDFNGLTTLAGAQIPDGTTVTWTVHGCFLEYVITAASR